MAAPACGSSAAASVVGATTATSHRGRICRAPGRKMVAAPFDASSFAASSVGPRVIVITTRGSHRPRAHRPPRCGASLARAGSGSSAGPKWTSTQWAPRLGHLRVSSTRGPLAVLTAHPLVSSPRSRRWDEAGVGRRGSGWVSARATAGHLDGWGHGVAETLAAALRTRPIVVWFTALLAVLLAWSAWRRRRLVPRLVLSSSARLGGVVAACPTLHRAMRPPLLLQTSLAQLVAYLAKRKWFPAAARARWRRQTLRCADGGEVALDWYRGHGDASSIQTEPLPDDAPVIAVLHTLTGLSDDFAAFASDARRAGFRVAVCLRRGHLGTPLRTPRFNLLGNVDDLDVHVAAIREAFPRTRLLAYGESAGTGLAVRYGGEKGERCAFDGIVCVCPGYDTSEGGAFSRFEPLLDKYLLAAVKGMFLEANEAVLRGGGEGGGDRDREAPISPGFDALMAARNMAELQRLVYAAEGYGSLEEYHANTNPMAVAGDIAVPLLVINSDDDPICTPSNVDENLWCFEGEVERALVRTPIGTHCCFYEGRTLLPRSSWATDASLEFFQAVLAQTPARNVDHISSVEIV